MHIVAYNEKHQSDLFEVRPRPGEWPISSDADEDEEDGRPQARDEIEDDDPHRVGSPPSRRLRRRVIAAAPTAASGAARAPGSLQSFGFSMAPLPAAVSQPVRRSIAPTVRPQQQQHFVRHPTAPVQLGDAHWRITAYSDSDQDKDDEVAEVHPVEMHASDVDDAGDGQDGEEDTDGRRIDSQGQHSCASASSTTEESQPLRPRKRPRGAYMKTKYRLKQNVLAQQAWCGSIQWPWLGYNAEFGFHCRICMNAPIQQRKKDKLSTSGYGVNEPIPVVAKLSEHLKGGQHAHCQLRDDLMKSQPKVRCHNAFAPALAAALAATAFAPAAFADQTLALALHRTVWMANCLAIDKTSTR